MGTENEGEGGGRGRNKRIVESDVRQTQRRAKEKGGRNVGEERREGEMEAWRNGGTAVLCNGCK